MAGILGKKIGMTQMFLSETETAAVTVIEAGPCPVIQVKDEKPDGYRAIQIGFDLCKPSVTKKPAAGRFKKAGCEPQRYVRELRLPPEENYRAGDCINVGVFEKGDVVDVQGVSVGKGFQGGVKRWGWHGGPKSHGSMSHRRVGSIGASASPSRVLKGQKLPGRMGNKKRTIQNLEVVKVDKENNILVVRGSVPGPENGYLIIRKAKKARKEKKK